MRKKKRSAFIGNVGNYKDAILQATEAQVPFVSILRSGVSVLRGTKEFVGGLKDELVKMLKSSTKRRNGHCEYVLWCSKQRL